MCTKPQILIRYNKSIKGKENGGNENGGNEYGKTDKT